MTDESTFRKKKKAIICEVCDDLGVVAKDVPIEHPDFGKAFPCPACSIHFDKVRESIRRMSRLEQHADRTFDTFKIRVPYFTENENHNLQVGVEQAKRYAQNPEGWLLMKGECGTGKTHLAAAIGHELVEQGRRTIFVTAPDLLDHLRSAFAPDSAVSYDQQFDTLCKTEILILDDLGAENRTRWAQEKLYQLINHRYTANLPTIITTNVEVDMMEDRIASRLSDKRLVSYLALNVPDFRRQGEIYGENSLNDLSVLSYYDDKTFDNFRTDLTEEKYLKRGVFHARHYAENPEGWLVILGGHGVGKTHLAVALARYWQTQNHEGEMLVARTSDVLDYWRGGFHSVENSQNFDVRFNNLKRISLLVLDDFYPAPNMSRWARDKLFQLLDYRYMAKKSVVITTTLKQMSLMRDDMTEFFSRFSDRSFANWITLGNRDYRQGGILMPEDDYDLE